MYASAPRRIGVLTLHRCVNYGSYWQARCLLEALRSRGLDAEILDHASWRFSRREWACAVDPLLPARSSPLDSALYAVKTLRFAVARTRLPRSRRFPLDRPERMEPFDLVIVGSDEVWNLEHPMYGPCPLFFGDGVRAERLVAYAASLGSYGAERGLGREWVERLRRFSAVSVRDENTRRALAAVMDREPELVLDPCLLLPPRLRSGAADVSSRPFVAVYGHSFTPAFATRIRAWARAARVRLLSIGYRNDWADEQWLTAGPDDFARAVDGASAVVTNFFHGCVFALRHEKPFACEPSPYRARKITGLMAMIGGERHILNDVFPAADAAAVLEEPLEPDVLARLESLRGASADYLDRALA